MLGAFEPFGRPHNADKIPHEMPQFAPALRNHHFLVRIGDPTFVPIPDRWRGGQCFPVRHDVARARFAKDKTLEQRIRGKAICSVQPGLRHFARGIKPGCVGAPVEIDEHAAAGVMLGRNHRDRLRRDVDSEFKQLGVNIGEMFANEFRRFVADVEMDIVKAQPFDFMIDRARNDIARRQFLPCVEARHETLARRRNLQLPAFAADRFGDQEILDLEIVETGRVELHEFHVRHPAARPPGHRNPVPRRAARRC